MGRANEQLVSLRATIRSFIYDDPYSVVAEYEEGGGFALRAQVKTLPDTKRMGLIVGDVVHNLRSALDHVVWQLSVENSGPIPDPIPDGSEWRRIAFPIFDSPSKYDGHPSPQGNPSRGSGPDKIWGIDERLHALFRALQPFTAGEDCAQRQALCVLQELANLDKHRTIPVVAIFVTTSFTARPEPPFGLPDGFPPFEAEFFDLAGPGPFKDGALLGRMRHTGSLALPLVVIPMQVDREHAFDVVFGEGASSVVGMPTVAGLEQLRDTVRNVIAAISDNVAALD